MRSLEFKSVHKTLPIVYLDMDGVLADFFGAIAKAHGVKSWREIHRQHLGVDQVAQKRGFFKSLPVLPNAAKLIAGIIKIANKYSILSSPLMSNVEDSSKEKAEWLEYHLKNHQPQAVIFDHEKFKFACQSNGTPNILIDDYDININLWEANGGIGILYEDDNYKEALQKLINAFRNKIDHKAEIDEVDNNNIDVSRRGGLYTAQQVLKYVTGVHHEYHMPKPIMDHKIWVLKNIPVSSIKTPEYVHQDDEFRRVIDINWKHVNSLTPTDIKNRPIVVNENGWVIDGNHRVTYARANGIEIIPALVPHIK